MSDAAVLATLGEHLARARLQKNLTQGQLAREAGVGTRTVVRLEHGASTQLTNFVRVLRVLGLLDNLQLLVPPPQPGPLEQLRARQHERKRASRRRSRPAQGGWSWDDSPREGGR